MGFALTLFCCTVIAVIVVTVKDYLIDRPRAKKLNVRFDNLVTAVDSMGKSMDGCGDAMANIADWHTNNLDIIAQHLGVTLDGNRKGKDGA